LFGNRSPKGKVTANHPLYLLRSKTYPVPPLEDPRLAVEIAAR